MEILRSRTGTWTIAIAPEYGAKLLQVERGGKRFFWEPLSISSGQWCVGGERTWVSPEFGEQGFFTTRDGSWFVPTGLDPGAYIETAENRYDSDLILRNRQDTEFIMRITRRIEIIEERKDSLWCRITSTMENTGTLPFEYPVGLWEILQLPAHDSASCFIQRDRQTSGIIPQDISVEDHYLDHGYLQLSSLTKKEQKKGFSAAECRGELIFHDRVKRTLIKFFPEQEPSEAELYADRVDPSEGPGDAMQWYSSGSSGECPSFCELELHSPARILHPGQQNSFVANVVCIDREYSKK